VAAFILFLIRPFEGSRLPIFLFTYPETLLLSQLIATIMFSFIPLYFTGKIPVTLPACITQLSYNLLTVKVI
jgi:hypothetical protein